MNATITTNVASRQRSIPRVHVHSPADRKREVRMTRRIEQQVQERELQLARAIQMSMLSSVVPSWEGYAFGARMVPAQAIGGDFYDFIPLDEDHLGIAVGDATGAGVPAALLMMQAASLLRIEARCGHSPAATLRRLNQHLIERNDLGLYVTLVYGVLDRRSGDFCYARAGHERPLIMTAQGSVYWPPLGIGMPLGVVSDVPLDDQAVSLPPGSTLLLYTDGVTETMDQRRSMFGTEHLIAEAQAHSSLPSQAYVDCICQKVTMFRGPHARPDDLTLVAIHAHRAGSIRFER